jgi:hypothetical protein
LYNGVIWLWRGVQMKPFEALRHYKVGGLAGVERIPLSQVPRPVILKSAIVSYCTPSPHRQRTKNTRFTKNVCSHYYGKSKQTCRNVKWECNWWPVSGHEPLDATPPSFREIYWPILRCRSLLTAGSR